MGKALCIHGHFYQPPREDPWLDAVLPEGSAAPFPNWNERICRESYAPLAWTRRLDNEGRVLDVLNCYEWMSFNFGPTLLRWMERMRPDVYRRILEGDRKSVERWGHGNAIAQNYHHVIMPLATPMDKVLQVTWAMQDFLNRFGRRSEGMWLAETAADTPTLEAMAEVGVKFTILAPRQAQAISDRDGEWRHVDESSLDTSQPYSVELPSGKTIAVFFYDGPLSQAVAFERLLTDGETFWQRLTAHPPDGLRALGTDGETYGHHFTFGEMSLGYVLDQARSGRGGWELTNFGAYLAENPPTMRVKIHEGSSWSCVHGVERWQSDCGCSTGSRPGWNQKWRGPLREALNMVRTYADELFFDMAPLLFKDPEIALRQYGDVHSGGGRDDDYAHLFLARGISDERRARAWKLLAMQQWSMASFASCAWFFDEISRLEPLNAMTFALRAMDIIRQLGKDDLRGEFADILSDARSNISGLGTGRDLFQNQVMPRMESPASLALQGLMHLWAHDRFPHQGVSVRHRWPGVSLEFTGPEGDEPGTVEMVWRYETEVSRYKWDFKASAAGSGLPSFESRILLQPARNTPATSAAQELSAASLPWNKRQEIALAWLEATEDRVWHTQLASARTVCALFLPYQEAQTTATDDASWASLFPALAWTWIMEDCGLPHPDADFAAFLSRLATEHPSGKILVRRVTDHCRRLLDFRPEKIPAILDRAERMGLGLDLWSIQNRYWENRDVLDTVPGLAERLWFALEPAEITA